MALSSNIDDVASNIYMKLPDMCWSGTTAATNYVDQTI